MLSWRTARRTPVIATSLVVTLGLLLPTPAHAAGTDVTGQMPGAVAAPAPVAPVDVTTTKVPAVAPQESSNNVVAELPQTGTSSFAMVGVTWTGGDAADVAVEVRTRADGVWSPWAALGVEVSAEGGVPGTEPLWVGDADGVAARVTSEGAAPQDIRIATIDPGSAGQTATAASAVTGASWSGASDGVALATTVADGAPAFTPMPSIITRSAWGASSGTTCSAPTTGDRTRGVVVHHTAGTNSYTKAESASIVRATQAYHVKSRKWCDLGYNFLVDKYGQIFEGRRGGLDRAVRAAHSGNDPVNTFTMGVSMMGNYDLAKPTTALQDSMVKLLGWRMGTNYLPAKGKYSLGGKSLNMIAGHRDVLSTACPGKYGYAWLSEAGGLRDRVEAYMAAYSTPIKSLYGSLGADAVGAIFVGEDRSSHGSRLRGKQMDLLSKTDSPTARAVSGAIRTEYGRVGSRTGVLGYPVSGAEAITGATRQSFDGGRIYQVGAAAYTLQGAAATTYAQLGETTGQLGAPTSSTTTTAGVLRSNFVNGYITTTVATGQTAAYTNAGAVITQTGGVAVSRPATVGRIKVKAGVHSARLTWPKVSGATSYDVCLHAARTSKSCARWVTGVSSPTTLISKLKPTKDTDYYAKVRAVNGSLKGGYSTLKGFNLATKSAAAKPAAKPVTPKPAAVATTSSVNSRTVPSSGKITVRGHGYGHGIGMSQYGAQGAATQGATFQQILATYYPGTELATKSGAIRVLISQDTSDPVDVKAASGLVFRKLSSNFTAQLPAAVDGATVTSWRIVQTGSSKTQSALQYKTSGSYRAYKGIRWTGDGQFEGPARISLMLPGGSAVKYRGAIRSAVPATGSKVRDTVNVLPIEHYVRGVIAAEMPAGWAPEALKAQAVAARTYGVRSLAPARYYDICSTTACQVYGGASRETASTDAAARATSGQFLSYQGTPALAQFSSSSGGRTSAGSEPYLLAGTDPYDGWAGNPNHNWTTSVTASKIQKAYPSIGKLKKLKVTKRTGGGSWGGRVATINLIGSKKTVTITGNDARWAFGLKSNWFGF